MLCSFTFYTTRKPGVVTYHTTCYAPASKKKRRKGSVFRHTASSDVVDVFPEKGVFFSSLSPFRGPISQSRFRHSELGAGGEIF